MLLALGLFVTAGCAPPPRGDEYFPGEYDPRYDPSWDPECGPEGCDPWGFGPGEPKSYREPIEAPGVYRAAPTHLILYRSIEIPGPYRKRNWVGDNRQGSCVHAVTLTLLRYQGLDGVADRWSYSGGEHASRHNRRLEAAGVDFASSRDGSLDVIQWAVRTRRGAGVSYRGPGGGYHCIALIGLDNRHATVIDPNRPGVSRRIPTGEFLATWRQFGGWSFALAHTPPPPAPIL